MKIKAFDFELVISAKDHFDEHYNDDSAKVFLNRILCNMFQFASLLAHSPNQSDQDFAEYLKQDCRDLYQELNKLGYYRKDRNNE